MLLGKGFESQAKERGKEEEEEKINITPVQLKESKQQQLTSR
jgi:hypothetical protein